MGDYSISWDGLDALDEALANQQNMNTVKKVVKKHTANLMTATQQAVPVDTGHLKQSAQIQISRDGFTGSVTYGGGLVNYAAYVEFGTRFMDARKYVGVPFMSERMKFIDDLRDLAK